MFKNTFFAKEPWFLKVIYVLAFLGIVYNIYLLIFTKNDIDALIQLLSSGSLSILLLRSFFKDQKKKLTPVFEF